MTTLIRTTVFFKIVFCYLSVALALMISTAFPSYADTVAQRDWWKPSTYTTWQWQLNGTLNTRYNVEVYDIDLFDTPVATISKLHAAGRKVVCYFSAGSSENWRPDFRAFRGSDMGGPLDDWVGERWLDINSGNVRRIMIGRLDLARKKGCDGVEPDNVDGYANDTELNLTAAQQINYSRFLAAQAHSKGLAIGLKNNVEQLRVLQPLFDFAVNEQCHEYRECDAYRLFTAAGKPVFVAEYARRYRLNVDDAGDRMCAAARRNSLQTLILPLSLDGTFRRSCNGR